jgi:hypothetical protein
MRIALAVVVLLLLVPAAALASDAPSPAAVSACQAEAAQLGKDAFVAKYGPTEPYGHCYAAHAESTAPPAPAPTDPGAACAAESVQLGADAPYRACVVAHGGVVERPQPQHVEGVASVASALCGAWAKSLGRDAFVATFGPKEAMGACVKKALAKAKALVASCRASSAASKDAFTACIAAGVRAPAPKRR